MHYCLLASTIDTRGARSMASSDRAAVYFALQSDAATVAICPDDDRLACEYAIAAGVRTVLRASTLPKADFDLAWAGTGFAERLGDLFLARWSEQASAQLLFDVLTCGSSAGGIRSIVCDAGRGARDELQVRGPCLLVLSAAVARAPYVSRHRRTLARQHASLGDFADQAAASEMNWMPARPRVRSSDSHAALGADSRMDLAFAIDASAPVSADHLMVADPETCARHLLRYLAHHGFLPHALPNENDTLPESTGAAELTRSVRPATTLDPPTMERSRNLSPAVQRRPRWTNSDMKTCRGPFWRDNASSGE